MQKKRSTLIFLVALTVVALIFCYIIARPFLMPIISAVVISIVFFPLHAQVCRAVRNPSLAALISTLLVFLVLVLPAIMIGVAIYREVREMYQALNEQA